MLKTIANRGVSGTNRRPGRAILALVLVHTLCIAGHSFGGSLTTVAGAGADGFNGDGIPAVNAWQESPTDVAIGPGGNIFIANRFGFRVRKVTASNGLISTIAGIGSSNSSGDGGPGTSAQIYYPDAIAVDAAGNVYVAENSGHRIRRIDNATGIITLVAGTGISGTIGDGGLATAARINTPSGLAIDTAGNIFIAEYNGCRVRRIANGTGIISTVAGTGVVTSNGDGGLATSAALWYPNGIAVDASGTLYISEYNGNRVRKVEATGGTISTIAGLSTTVISISTTGYGGDGGIGTNAFLNRPAGLAVDSTGNLYVADYANHRIRKVNSFGIISTFAGTGVDGFSGDGLLATTAQINNPDGLALDAAKNLYIADRNNNRVRKIDASTLRMTTIAGGGIGGYSGDGGAAVSADLRKPQGVYAGPGGDVYLSDTRGYRIRKIAGATGVISTIAGTGDTGFGGDGIPAVNSAVSGPAGLALGPDGNLYFADSGNYRLRMINAAGNISTVAGDGTPGSTGDGGAPTSAKVHPDKICIAPNGDIYIADSTYNRVRWVSGGIINTVAGTGATTYNGDGIAASSAQLNNPAGVRLDKAGNLFIVEGNGNRVRRVDVVSGKISTVAGTGTGGYGGDGGLATAASLNTPSDVEVDVAGNLYISDSQNCRIRKVDAATGIITTVAGTGFFGFNGDGSATSSQLFAPEGLSLDSSGNLYIADYSNYRIRRLTNDPPVLAWTGESGYTADGVSPDSLVKGSGVFTFRVKYSDAEGTEPANGGLLLHIKRGAAVVAGSPFAMAKISGDMVSGAIYSATVLLDTVSSAYSYRFEAKDLYLDAVGTATPWTAGPGVDIVAVDTVPAVASVFDRVKARMSKGEVLVAPNKLDLGVLPAKIVFYFRGDSAGTVALKLFDATGKVVKEFKVALGADGFGSQEFDGTGIRPGVYWAYASGAGVKGKKGFIVKPRK